MFRFLHAVSYKMQLVPIIHSQFYFFVQILTSVWQHLVIPKLNVRTLVETSSVHVLRDTVEMELIVLVRMHFTVWH